MCLIKSGRKASLQAVVSWFGVVWRWSIRPESITPGGGIVVWSSLKWFGGGPSGRKASLQAVV